MKTGILIFVAVLATACSSDPAKSIGASDTTAQTSTETVCTYERPTGSFMKEKRCTTAAEREAARQQQGLMDTRNQRDSGAL
jgi:hypothetical protein